MLSLLSATAATLLFSNNVKQPQPPPPLCDLRSCGPLKIHANQHHLAYADGSAFYYAADTPWHLVAELSPDDARHFIDTRAAQGFSVLQISALPMNPGMKNYAGQGPGIMSPPALNEAYWAAVDDCLVYMEKIGMVAYMVPIWATNWAHNNAMTAADHYQLGKLLATRWRDRNNILWVLGGDEPGQVSADCYQSLMRGVQDGTGPSKRDTLLFTCHVTSGFSSSSHCGPPALIASLSFHSIQDRQPDEDQDAALVRADFLATGAQHTHTHADTDTDRENNKGPKPTLMAETFYENVTSGGQFNLHLTRGPALREAYWGARLAGSLGDAYGCWGLWFTMLRRQPTGWCWPAHGCSPSLGWREDVALPGAADIAGTMGRVVRTVRWWTLTPNTDNSSVVPLHSSSSGGSHGSSSSSSGGSGSGSGNSRSSSGSSRRTKSHSGSRSGVSGMHIGLTHLESTSSTSIGDVEAVVIYLRTPTSFGLRADHIFGGGRDAIHAYAGTTGTGTDGGGADGANSTHPSRAQLSQPPPPPPLPSPSPSESQPLGLSVLWYDPSGGEQSGSTAGPLVKATALNATAGAVVRVPAHEWAGDAVLVIRRRAAAAGR